MSIATQISRITALRNRIRAKAMSLGLLTSSRDGADSINLADCTAAIESIDEVSPYMINTPGIKNVAGFKYAQIDQSAWVPAGSTPSGLVSVVTGLSSAGITQSTPRNPVSIGTVYPPTGYQGIYANELQIDADVIKPENIKAGVQMLGVTGSYTAPDRVLFIDGYVEFISGNVVFSNVPFNTISDMYYMQITLYPGSSNMMPAPIIHMFTVSGLTNPGHGVNIAFSGWKLSGAAFFDKGFACALSANNNGGWNFIISPNQDEYFANNDYEPAVYQMLVILNG